MKIWRRHSLNHNSRKWQECRIRSMIYINKLRKQVTFKCISNKCLMKVLSSKVQMENTKLSLIQMSLNISNQREPKQQEEDLLTMLISIELTRTSKMKNRRNEIFWEHQYQFDFEYFDNFVIPHSYLGVFAKYG